MARLLTFICTLPLVVMCRQHEPVDYVNPYIGNISHLLVPTYPTVHLPYQMLRVYPERADFTSDRLNGLPTAVTSHRGRSAFRLYPSGEVSTYSYDNEAIKPYLYSVRLDEEDILVQFAPAAQAGVYDFTFSDADCGNPVMLTAEDGNLHHDGDGISGYQDLDGKVKIYLYAEFSPCPMEIDVSDDGLAVTASFGSGNKVTVRYGISFISEEQARRNMERDISDAGVEKIAARGRKIWNSTLSKIKVKGGSEADRRVFYTSLCRTCERMVLLSEDGRYYSAADGNVHEDGGRDFYTDDWIWDTYRAVHPLRVLIEPERETDMMNSYLAMAEQSQEKWIPTFPEVTGDSHRMNGNHAVAMFLDGYRKGLTDFDVNRAFELCRKTLEEKTLLPWKKEPVTELDRFYFTRGFFPALTPGEVETCASVHPFERRQAVSVMMGDAYDCWCLLGLASEAGRTDDMGNIAARALSYRNVFNPETGFFHPKRIDGEFIRPFDYRYSGGQGARAYYCENNAWIYRWDVQHNITDMVDLAGGRTGFAEALDSMFAEPLGMAKYDFYSRLPDHTGNVGQFSMANEPCLHIPYLYNYAGQPWKTQKRVRALLSEWFRDDLMGVPGDEDGGGMSAFVVFSMMGFYPVTPGLASYNVGSPVFRQVKIDLGNGKILKIRARNASSENRYIQSASLNGKPLDRPWFTHDDVRNGGRIVFVMGSVPNKEWGADDGSEPPSWNNN